MVVLPLIERELRTQARKPALYWGRFAVGSVAVLICLFGLTISGFTRASNVGSQILTPLIGTLFGLAGFGFLLTCDAITEERREGTLGLLFLTSVSLKDVLLGKLSVLGLGSLSALVTTIPVLTIPIMAGGVTGGEVFRNGLALVNTLLVSLTSGLWSSACGGSRVRVAGRAFLVMVAIAILGMLRTGGVPQIVRCLSYLEGFFRATDVIYRTGAQYYWWSLLGGVLWSGLFLWDAARRLRGSTLDSVPDVEPVRNSRRNPGKIGAIEDATVWIVTRQRTVWFVVWAGTLFGAFYSILFHAIRLWSQSTFLQVASWGGWLTGMVQYGCYAWVATFFFIEARKSGELELLVATPLGKAGILEGHWNGLKRIFEWPLAIALITSLCWNVFDLYLKYLPAIWAACIHACTSLAHTAFLIVAICRIGMWMGMWARTQLSAILGTLFVIFSVQYVSSCALSFLLHMLMARSGPVSPEEILFPQICHSIGNLIALWWIARYAKRKLKALFEHEGSIASDLNQIRSGLRRGWAALRTWRPS